MSDTSPIDQSARQESLDQAAHGDSRTEAIPFPSSRTPSRWPTFAALAIALIAVALAIAAWFRPAPEGAPTFTDQQTAHAKTEMCSAYTAVHQAVVVNTHLANPRPDDPIGQLSVATNARLALLGGGTYLRDRLAAEPGAPADLAKALNSMANTIEQLGINYLAGATNIVQDPLRNNLNSEIAEIDKMCA